MSQQSVSCADATEAYRLSGGLGARDAEQERLLALLDERLRFESLLSRLSTTFINLSADHIDGQIERGLQQLVEFLDIDRSSVAQFSEDGTTLLMTHSYTTGTFPRFPRADLAGMMPWYAAQVRAGPEIAVPKPTIAPNSARISSSAASIRGTCNRSNTRKAG